MPAACRKASDSGKHDSDVKLSHSATDVKSAEFAAAPGRLPSPPGHGQRSAGVPKSASDEEEEQDYELSGYVNDNAHNLSTWFPQTEP